MSNSDLQSQAQTLDSQDSLQAIREEFRIPTKADIKRKTLTRPSESFLFLLSLTPIYL